MLFKVFALASIIAIVAGEIQSITPSTGQAGTVVTIDGVELLAGGNSVVQAVLAGVEAEIISSTDDKVVVRASAFETEDYFTGDVVLVSAPAGAEVSMVDGWTYEPSAAATTTTVATTTGTFF